MKANLSLLRKRTSWVIVLALIVFVVGIRFELLGTKEERETIHILAEALTFVALLFAWVQFIDAHQQTNRLGAIQESLSNRYISSFPTYIADITKLVEATQSNLVVFCDVPAYGAYSAPEASLSYQHAVRRAAERFEVKVVCYDSTSRKKFNKQQFKTELADWDHFKQTDKKRLEHLLKLTGSSYTVEELEGDQFIDLLDEEDAAFLKQLGKLATVEQRSHIMSMYFWVRDGDEAVFVVPNLTHAGDEHGFRTEDGRLVRSLLDLQQRYCDQPQAAVTQSRTANEKHPPCDAQ